MNFNIPPSVSMRVELSETGSDFSNLDDLLFKKNELEEQAAHIFAEDLKNEASKYLYTTEDLYIESIHINDNVVTLDTSSFIINMIEEGTPSFDMKKGHLEGPNVKVNARGQKYAVVPISKYNHGKYNWRDKTTGKFDKGSNVGGDVEFRIISENSPADSWIHPGYHGFRFVHNVLQDFDAKIDQLINEKINTVFNK